MSLCFYVSDLKMTESHNTRLGGIKQDIQDFKSDFNSLLSSLKNKIQSKFENINTTLNQIESNLENSITEQVNESILSVKDSTMNEYAISIEAKIKLSDLYPDFVFCEIPKQATK